MASSFPGAIDSFTDPLSTSPLNSPSHSAQHADLNDAVEKIETKLGIGATVIGGAATSFTPTFINYTRGNGTSIAFHTRVNKLCYVYVEETLGSTSSVTGVITLVLPFTAARLAAIPVSRSRIDDTGTNVFFGTVLPASTTTVSLYADLASGTYVAFSSTSSTVPMTWATGDKFTFAFDYEIA